MDLIGTKGKEMTVEAIDTAQTTAASGRLPVRGDYAVRLLRFTEIRYVEARDRNVYVSTRDGSEHRTNYTLTQLEALLPKDTFIRVHDSYLVRQDEIEELLFLGNHSYEIRISTDRRLPVGRTRYAKLRRSLGLDSIV